MELYLNPGIDSRLESNELLITNLNTSPPNHSDSNVDMKNEAYCQVPALPSESMSFTLQ